jgi:serine/threonine protein phosphatase 1
LLLNFIDQPETGPAWMAVGGSETLLSYGIQPPLQNEFATWKETSDRLLMAMPLEHLIFYEELTYYHQEGDYHFVHAGVRQGISLEEQAPEDMLWIRDSFLKDARAFDKMIVHGHTPGPEVYSDHRRICLDTGSYATGVLTAIRLQGADRELHQARRGGGKVRMERLVLDRDKAGVPG